MKSLYKFIFVIGILAISMTSPVNAISQKFLSSFIDQLVHCEVTLNGLPGTVITHGDSNEIFTIIGEQGSVKVIITVRNVNDIFHASKEGYLTQDFTFTKENFKNKNLSIILQPEE